MAMLICSDYKMDDVDKFILDVKSRVITLPYKRSYTSDENIRAKFLRLAGLTLDDLITREFAGEKYKITKSNFEHDDLVWHPIGAQLLFVTKNTDYEDTGAISDMFQEHNRLKARFIGALYSSHNFFYAFPEIIAADCMKTYGAITPYNARESLYWKSNECSAFNPMILVYLIKKFGATSVFDFCAGWGDRLIAAIATNVRYLGVDPNTELTAGYEAIKNFFIENEDEKKRYTILPFKIQDAILPRTSGGPETFDLVFTSPPYWNMEEYTGEGCVKEASENEWLWNFLWPAIDISLRRLNQAGHLALNLNQNTNQTYLQKMLKWMSAKLDIKFLGVISYTDKRRTNPQPIWIWQKVVEVSPKVAPKTAAF